MVSSYLDRWVTENSSRVRKAWVELQPYDKNGIRRTYEGHAVHP